MHTFEQQDWKQFCPAPKHAVLQHLTPLLGFVSKAYSRYISEGWVGGSRSTQPKAAGFTCACLQGTPRDPSSLWRPQVRPTAPLQYRQHWWLYLWLQKANKIFWVPVAAVSLHPMSSNWGSCPGTGWWHEKEKCSSSTDMQNARQQDPQLFSSIPLRASAVFKPVRHIHKS